MDRDGKTVKCTVKPQERDMSMRTCVHLPEESWVAGSIPFHGFNIFSLLLILSLNSRLRIPVAERSISLAIILKTLVLLFALGRSNDGANLTK